MFKQDFYNIWKFDPLVDKKLHLSVKQAMWAKTLGPWVSAPGSSQGNRKPLILEIPWSRMIWHIFLELVLELQFLSLLGQDTRKVCIVCFHQCIQGGMRVEGGRGVVQREHTHRMGLRQKQSDQPVLG